MNFEPQKFFIGLMDFFSILLPGALLTYLLMGEVGPVVLGNRYAALGCAEAWAAFLFASYLFGHLVFLLGSWLDEFYDWARRYTLNMVIKVIIRLGDILIHAADDEFLCEATRLDTIANGCRPNGSSGCAIGEVTDMNEHTLFYYPSASFTNAKISLLKVAVLYLDKLFVLDPVGRAGRLSARTISLRRVRF